MKKETKHYTLVSFLETTKPLVKSEILRQYPHINVEYYDKVADMYFYILRLMVVQEITAMCTDEFPIVQLINRHLRKYGMYINRKGIVLDF